MFEQAFPTTFELVYPPTLDAGNLKSKFDILIFPGGAIPGGEGGRGGRGGGGGGRGGGAAGGGRGGRGGAAREVPDEYKNEVGNITLATTGPQLRKFVEEGGTILAIGSSTGIGAYLGVPVTSALTERGPDGAEQRLSGSKFYVPGSVLQASVDNSTPIAYGLPDKVDVFYDNSPAFRFSRTAAKRMGVGRTVPERRGRGGGSQGGRREGSSLCTGDHFPRSTPRYVQVSLQRH
jgi:hypothetical protein